MDDGQKITLDDGKTNADRLSTFLHMYGTKNTSVKPKQVIFQCYNNTRFVCNVTTKKERDETEKLMRWLSEDK
jgi:hypothetical protein